MKEKTVYIIFKTHLDIGYTDFSAKIIENYLNNYIPKAIRLGRELEGSETPFRWSLGSWMVEKALKEDKSGEVERAIKDGILNWHALPFTSHTELESPKLFEYGLEISKKLDKRFGKTTIASKMTDVPGHTAAMVPCLAKYGIKFLHIGINEASPMPKVPELFKWRFGGEEITVMYHDAYGAVSVFDDFVVYFAHTNDNTGPQSREEIEEIFATAAARFPEHKIISATLDDVAERLSELEGLPVIESEIGDTWIHGAATDPEKLSRYRHILREIEGRDINGLDLSENLLLVPEHTWGVSCAFLPEGEVIEYTGIENVGKAGIEKYTASWNEQRKYVTDAEKLLGITPEYPISRPELSGARPCELHELPYEISFQVYSYEDFEIYKKQYLRLTESTIVWALNDYTKDGIPRYESKTLTAKPTEAYEKGEKRIYKLEFDRENAEKFGLPEFYIEAAGGDITVSWFGKKPSRLPQAFWFKFKGLRESWEVEKLGAWIKTGGWLGSPLISGIGRGIRNGEYMIESLDAGVVSPFGRNLYRLTHDALPEDMYFNLYNNEWNTNFPLWYSDDAIFRFKVTKM